MFNLFTRGDENDLHFLSLLFVLWIAGFQLYSFDFQLIVGYKVILRSSCYLSLLMMMKY